MNVKPGDFAKVVAPHSRAGVLVSVVAPCGAADFAMLCRTDAEWREAKHVWLCRLLTGSKAIVGDTGVAGYLLPGDEAWIADIYLRRIDPKADDTTDETARELEHA